MKQSLRTKKATCVGYQEKVSTSSRRGRYDETAIERSHRLLISAKPIASRIQTRKQECLRFPPDPYALAKEREQRRSTDPDLKEIARFEALDEACARVADIASSEDLIVEVVEATKN
jgi:hypothetical protein